MIVILSKEEYDKKIHTDAIYCASLVFVQETESYIKAKDRLEGCGQKTDRYKLEDLLGNIEKHVQIYNEAYFKSKEIHDTNEQEPV